MVAQASRLCCEESTPLPPARRRCHYFRSRQGIISPIFAVTPRPLRRAAGVNRLVTSDEHTEQTRAMTGPARRGNNFFTNSKNQNRCSLNMNNAAKRNRDQTKIVHFDENVILCQIPGILEISGISLPVRETAKGARKAERRGQVDTFIPPVPGRTAGEFADP